MNPLPTEAIRTTSQPLSAVSPTEGSPVVGPRRALDMLTSVLREGGPGEGVEAQARKPWRGAVVWAKCGLAVVA